LYIVVIYSKRIKVIKNSISNRYVIQPFFDSAIPFFIRRCVISDDNIETLEEIVALCREIKISIDSKQDGWKL
jgi:hypothetical protein